MRSRINALALALSIAASMLLVACGGAAAPAAEPTAPTLEEVRAKLTVYRDSGKNLKELLATVDAPHLIAVPPERYSELLANMEKM